MKAIFVAVMVGVAVARGAAAECQTFKDMDVSGPEIAATIEEHGCVTLEDVKVNGDVVLWKTRQSPVTFRAMRTEFRGVVRLMTEAEVSFSAEACTFGEFDGSWARGHLTLFKSRVTGETDLQSFRGHMSLNSSTFAGPVRLMRAELPTLDLAYARFGDGVDLSGATIKQLIRANGIAGGIEIRWDQFGPAWLARVTAHPDNHVRTTLAELAFWQRNANALGYDRDVTAISAEIARLRRKSEMRKTEAEYWQSLAFDLVNGYGTRPFRPVWYALFVIVAFGTAYTLRNPFVPTDKSQRPRRPLMLFALCFSLDTFLPAIELTGVRKWGWGLRDDWRWVELLERLLGALLTVFLAYGVSRFI